VRKIPKQLVWKVISPSEEKMDKLLAVARVMANIDRVSTSVSMSFPGGNLKTKSEHRYLADYFENIEVSEEEDSSFVITFFPREDPPHFWKDLLVDVLSTLRNEGAEIEHLRGF